tara:strand:- start:405 stop:569 length:165 start_codon:yes stop_codon:yes gene_type:complete
MAQKNNTMAIKKEFKVWLHGRRRLLFERTKKEKGLTNAAFLRLLIDFYFDNKKS